VAGAEADRSETGSPRRNPLPLNNSDYQKVKGMKIHEGKRGSSIHQYNHPQSKDASINKEVPP
jgi:hypothetical protein